jgi:hypothetical protein
MNAAKYAATFVECSRFRGPAGIVDCGGFASVEVKQ